MKTKFEVIFATLVVFAMSQCVFASIETMPDIDTFNWNTADDFSDINYSLNNWSLDLPSAINFGINADNEYGYLKASNIESPVSGEIIPTQNNNIFGIRADIRLTALSTWYSTSYYALGFDLFPDTQTSLYWGILAKSGGLRGRLLLRQNGSTSFLSGPSDFDVAMQQTYNLAIVFDDVADEYYLYLNGEKKTNVSFPGDGTSFSSGHFRMYSEQAYAQFEFDNIEFATVPEPATLFLLGLGGLIFRKRQI